MGVAKLIRVDGTVHHVVPHLRWFTQRELEVAVGGYFERVPCILPGHWLFVDGNARNAGKCINIKATNIQKTSGTQKPIFGDAFLVPEQLLSLC